MDACYGSISPAVFGLNIIVAKHFGLVKEKDGGGWELGPNAHYDSYDYFGYNSRPALKTYWPLETDMQGDDECIVQRQMQIYFSRYKKWTFGHLNRSFGEVANIESSRAALVYCDLVQSTLVGNQKHPLLREITIPDSGGCASIGGTLALPVVAREKQRGGSGARASGRPDGNLVEATRTERPW